MADEISFEQIKKATLAAAAELRNHRQYFNDLDSEIGDSDHGDSIDFTFKKVQESVEGYDESNKDVGNFMKSVGRSIIMSGGAAMGPLYGTALYEAGKVIEGKTSVGYDDLAAMWTAFADGIQKRGGVQLGEKTMYDTIRPAADAFAAGHKAGKPLSQAVADMKQAAEDGMNSTKDKVSLRGRSSRLGDRSQGHIDPGSASMLTFVTSYLDALVG